MSSKCLFPGRNVLCNVCWEFGAVWAPELLGMRERMNAFGSEDLKLMLDRKILSYWQSHKKGVFPLEFLLLPCSIIAAATDVALLWLQAPQHYYSFKLYPLFFLSFLFHINCQSVSTLLHTTDPPPPIRQPFLSILSFFSVVQGVS